MAVPRRRHSNARKNSKRAHHAMVAKQLQKCSNCSKMTLPHCVCPSCGHYNGKPVFASASS